jgi:hypothetical protein
MIKHIVTWKLKDFAENADKKSNALELKEKLLGLKSRIPEINKIEVHFNSLLASQDNDDVILIAEFKGFNELETYIKHPDHQKVADFISRIRDTRVAIDFEI